MSLPPTVAIPTPTDSERFEQLVADLLERDRGDFRISKSSRQEEGDMYFESADGGACAWCLYTDDLSFETIETEIAEADLDASEVGECVVATTARVDDDLRERVEKWSRKREADGEPSVRLLFWEDVEDLLTDNEVLFREYDAELYRDLETIREAGFVRVTEGLLDRQPTTPPEVCWQTTFTLADVAAGHAFERWHDGPGSLVTDELVSQLRDGTNTVVLGPSGSGKSTICKAVACRWVEQDYGTVFYRPSETPERFDAEDLDRLRERIEFADGDVLVVVEDAKRPDAVTTADLLDRFRDYSDVTFLLDSQMGEWRNYGEMALDSRQSHAFGKGIREYEVPSISASECRAIVEYFEDMLDATLDLSDDQLHGDLSSEQVSLADSYASNSSVPAPPEPFEGAGVQSAGVWQMLLLAYRLAVSVESRASTAETTPQALKTGVREAYHAVDDDDYTRALSLLVTLLSASGIGVYPELVYAFGDGPDDYRRISDALDDFEGVLVFGEQNGRYRSHHEQWSELFLEYALEQSGEWTVELVEQAVNALFSLVDSPDERESVHAWFERELPYLDAIGADPQTIGDVFVEKLFDVGRRRPTLAPLFGTTDDSEIELPEVCSPMTTVEATNWRGQLFRDRGEFERAEAEFQRLDDVADGVTGLSDDQRETIRAWKLNNLGNVAQLRGVLDEAEDYYLRSMSAIHDLGDKRGQTTLLGNLGQVARSRGALDDAENYYERSLDLERELGDERGRATSLNNLGSVAQSRGDYEVAADYYERSFELLEELGDERGQATTLNNIGNVARARGDYDEAAEYYERSYAILLNLVDGRGQAQSLGNLGVVARARGDLDAAKDYYQRSLNLMRELNDPYGEATSLNNLGNVARARENLDAAEDYYRRSLIIKRDVGDERGQATTLNNLGNVARSRGNYDDAAEYYERSLELKRDVDDEHGEATSLNNLGLVAQENGDYESAREYFETAVDVFSDLGTIDEALTALENAIDACEQLGDSEAAIENCELALSLATQAGTEDKRREFQRIYAHLSGRDPEESTLELYRLAPTHVLETEPMDALARFAETWERRSELDPDSDAYATTLDAGVYLAAHFHLLDGNPTNEFPDPREILDVASEEYHRLSPNVEPLFEYLTDGEADATPRDLRDRADEADDELAYLEAKATAILLENLW